MEDVAALGCGLIVGLPVGLELGPDEGLSVSSVMGGGISSASPVQLSSQGMEATNAAVKPPIVLSGAQATSNSFTPARLSPWKYSSTVAYPSTHFASKLEKAPQVADVSR
jgi:hypothetical protein